MKIKQLPFVSFCFLFLSIVLAISVIVMFSQSYTQHTDEQLTQDILLPELTEQAEAVILSHLQYPESTSFSSSTFRRSVGLARVDGHLTTKTHVREDHDMLYTVVFMLQGDDWNVVYSEAGMHIYQDTLTN